MKDVNILKYYRDELNPSCEFNISIVPTEGFIAIIIIDKKTKKTLVQSRLSKREFAALCDSCSFALSEYIRLEEELEK